MQMRYLLPNAISEAMKTLGIFKLPKNPFANSTVN